MIKFTLAALARLSLLFALVCSGCPESPAIPPCHCEDDGCSDDAPVSADKSEDDVLEDDVLNDSEQKENPPTTVIVNSNPFAELNPDASGDMAFHEDGELPFPYTKKGDDYFSIIMLPDTQLYIRDDPAYFEAQIDWIIEHRKTLNIQLVAHVGDIVYDYDRDEEQWETASDIMKRLDHSDIPYLTLPGNHDYHSKERDSTMYNDWFPLSRFENMETFEGAFESDKSDNTYHICGTDPVPLLILALEWAPRDEVLVWANEVVDDYPDHNVIVVTHAYVHEDNSLIDDDNDKRAETRLDDDDNFNEGDDIWEALIRKNDNIFMVLSGHCGSDSDPVGNRVTENDDGGPVYQQMLNYQRYPLDDNGYLMVLQFFPGEDLIIVSSWSPWFNQFDPRDDAQFFIVDDTLFEDS